MKGRVTITKVYKNGVREQVCSEECNIITDGLGIALVNLFTTNSELFDGNVGDFQFAYFQMGTESYVDTAPLTDEQFDGWEGLLPEGVENNFYELSAPLTYSEYGTDTTVHVDNKKIIAVEEQFLAPDELSYVYKEQPVAFLERSSTTRFVEDAMHIKLNIDEGAAIGKDLKEFGLFIRNPRKFRSDDRPVLSAYKILQHSITKTDQFSIDVDWSIDFQ
jgi:hypothetical protein